MLLKNKQFCINLKLSIYVTVSHWRNIEITLASFSIETDMQIFHFLFAQNDLKADLKFLQTVGRNS